jgi:hypothetical protein
MSTNQKDPDNPDVYLDEENILDRLQEEGEFDILQLISDNQVLLNRVNNALNEETKDLRSSKASNSV